MNSKHLAWNRLAGLAVVLVLHGIVLYGLMRHRLIPLPDKVETLFVNFIQPPVPPQPEPPKPKPPEPPKPVKLEKPHPPEPRRHLVVEAPAAATDYVMPPPPHRPHRHKLRRWWKCRRRSPNLPSR